MTVAAAGPNPLLPAHRRELRGVKRPYRCGAKRTTFADGRPPEPRGVCVTLDVAGPNPLMPACGRERRGAELRCRRSATAWGTV